MVTVLGTLHRTYIHVPMIRHFRRLHIIIMIFLKSFFSFLFLSTHFLLEPLKILSSFFEMRSHHRYCTIPILNCPEEIEVRSTFFLVFFLVSAYLSPFSSRKGGHLFTFHQYIPNKTIYPYIIQVIQQRAAPCP